MRCIAAEIAVSETAFLSLNDFRLRWFTPLVEVDLCGHGTLAVAHVLKEKGHVLAGEEVTFNTLSGGLRVKIDDQKIEMNFPAAVVDVDIPLNHKMLDYLGIQIDQVKAFGVFNTRIFIELNDEQQLHDLKPNFDALKQLQGRSVLVTAKATSSKIDFISRYFALWVGVNEDPVTGTSLLPCDVLGEEIKQISINRLPILRACRLC